MKAGLQGASLKLWWESPMTTQPFRQHQSRINKNMPSAAFVFAIKLADEPEIDCDPVTKPGRREWVTSNWAL